MLGQPQAGIGAPAQPDKEFKRQVIALRYLPELLKKVSMWEKKLGMGAEE